MAIIYSYPLVTSLSDSDLMLITSRDNDNELFTGSVKYETLKDSILSSFDGTDNYIPKFSQGALVNSNIYQGGTNIGIGTNDPSQKLDVVGSIEVSDGIYIGGTAAANKLDDYEKGEFVPVLTTSGTEPSITTKQGRYTKIGDTVFVEIRLRDFVSENESNAVTGCTNLPFTVLDTLSSTFVTGNAFGTRYTSNSTYAGRQYVYASDNTTTLTFRNGELLGIGFEADENSEISVSIIYKTA